MVSISHLKEVSAAQFEDICSLERELHSSDKIYPREFLDDLLSDQNAFFIAALNEGRIVGMGTLYLMHKLDNRAAHIEDVIVSSEYRGQGLGEKVMQALIDTAKQQGVRTLNLTSRPSREAANKLYQKLGFELRETNAYKLKLS